jgi:hypothetical protein
MAGSNQVEPGQDERPIADLTRRLIFGPSPEALSVFLTRQRDAHQRLGSQTQPNGQATRSYVNEAERLAGVLGRFLPPDCAEQ